MMLGIAASTSTNDVSGRRIRGGAYSVTNSAAHIATGTAITKAITAIRNVPSSAAHTPKRPVSGVHTDFVKNDKPVAWSASHDLRTRNNPIKAMSVSVRIPLVRTT